MEISLTGNKSTEVKNLIFSLLDILDAVGVPITGLSSRRLEKMAMACLAVGHIKTSFNEAISSESGIFLKSRDIINFENQFFSENISPGSYDDIRRKDLILLVEAFLVVRSSYVTEQATNNPSRGYALSPDFSNLLRSFGTENWETELSVFQHNHEALCNALERRRELAKIPVILPNGEKLKLSFGEHNELQKAIIEEFLPRFGFGADILYVGDTTDKFLLRRDEDLKRLNFFTLEHDELPDVVAYSTTKNLLYLIEAVHSSGTMSEMRVRKLKKMLSNCPVEIVFFTAFQTKDIFRRWVCDIAWETEVWIAEAPEHLIHFNGYKFLEIHNDESQADK